MDTRLRPCPFCGGQEIITDDAPGPFGESVVRYAAKCVLCGVSFWHPECDFACGESAGIDWNTRPIEEALQRKLDVAVGALESVRENCRNKHIVTAFMVHNGTIIDRALREIGGMGDG